MKNTLFKITAAALIGVASIATVSAPANAAEVQPYQKKMAQNKDAGKGIFYCNTAQYRKMLAEKPLETWSIFDSKRTTGCINNDLINGRYKKN